MRFRPIIPAALAAILLAACGTATQGHGAAHTSRAARASGSQSATGSVAAMGQNAPPGWGTQGPAPSLELGPSASTATMYDSISVSAIPANPFADAGYTGGIWPTDGPLRARWPHAHTISIAIEPWEHADCLDVEPLDAEPDEVVAWDEREARAGREPCDYSDYYEWTHEIDPALASAGISLTRIFRWDAYADGIPHIDSGFEATQWDFHCLGRELDCSLVDRSFLSIAQPPLDTPKPKPTPVSHAKQIAELRALARAHGCYRKHHRKPHACGVWARQVKALEGVRSA